MIPYTYEVIESTTAGMVIRYASDGRPTLEIGTHAPRVGESVEGIAHQYAPIAYWQEIDTERVVVPVGTAGSFTPPPVPVETLETVKAAKRAEIAAWRYDREVGGITVNGVRINTERDSQAIIGNTLLSMREGFVTTVDWKTETGAFVQIGLPQLQGIAAAVAQHVQACFTAEAFLLAQVDAATSIEAVREITPPEIVR